MNLYQHAQNQAISSISSRDIADMKMVPSDILAYDHLFQQFQNSIFGQKVHKTPALSHRTRYGFLTPRKRFWKK